MTTIAGVFRLPWHRQRCTQTANIPAIVCVCVYESTNLHTFILGSLEILLHVEYVCSAMPSSNHNVRVCWQQVAHNALKWLHSEPKLLRIARKCIKKKCSIKFILSEKPFNLSEMNIDDNIIVICSNIQVLNLQYNKITPAGSYIKKN